MNLLQCFGQTLSQDPNIRKKAELDLRKVSQNQGFIGAVLSVVEANDDISVKQAAAVYLKNAISKRWSEEINKETAITQQEKLEFRDRLMQAIIASPINVRLQLTSVLHTILGIDFPERWPDFLNRTIALLQSTEIDSVYPGLLCLLEIARVYRWRSHGRRKGLDDIIGVAFPLLLHIGNGLVEEQNALAGDMLRIILKIYKSVIWLELSPVLQDMSSLVPWGQLLLKVVTKQPPSEAMVADLEVREAHVWWKAKKWAYFCLDRLFSRYGDPTVLTGGADKDYSDFARIFSSQFAPVILKQYLEQIQLWSTDRNAHWLSPRSLYLIGNFLQASVTLKSTWVMLKENVDFLIREFVFPQLCQTEVELELWETDPQEYINQRIDIYDDYSSPSVAATNFLVALTSKRKARCFMTVLEFINTELTLYQQAPDGQKNPIRKEGALCMMGSMAHLIMAKGSPVITMMEGFFQSHIFPEFKSPHGYLRARSCEMMNRFAEINFKNQQNIAIAYEGVLACLTEKELPVRVEAALALQPLIRQDFVHNAMIQSIPQIMKVLLELANQIDVDSLSNVMEEFVEVFSSELTPYAVELAEQLRDTFLRIMSESSETTGAGEGFTWDAQEDKSLAALGILNTIATLILSLENTPEAFTQLELTVLPVIDFTLDHLVLDLYAEIFEIIDSCTFSAKRISPAMWGVFVKLHQAFKTSCIDYMEEMLPALENYVAFGSETMKANSAYPAAIFDIVQTIFTNTRLGVQDRVAAAKLSQIFLLHMHGHVDQFLHPMMDLVMTCLANPSEPKKGNSYIVLVELLVNCIYYNPVASLTYMESRSGTAEFFNMWLSSLAKFRRVYDIKLVILTIISLLSLPTEQVPQSVRAGWPQLTSAMLVVFSKLPEAIKRRESEEHRLATDDRDYWNPADEAAFDGSNADWDDENGKSSWASL